MLHTEHYDGKIDGYLVFVQTDDGSISTTFIQFYKYFHFTGAFKDETLK